MNSIERKISLLPEEKLDKLLGLLDEF